MADAQAPRHWHSPHGEPLALRPIAPSDFDIEAAFVAGLSAETSYNRLFSWRRPDEREIARWTNIDPAREDAWVVVCEPGSRAAFMVGVARWVRDDIGPDAEFAVVVADAWKRRGIGLALLDALIARAREARIRALYGMTFAGNADMLALGRRLGFGVTRAVGETGVVRLTRSLAA